MQILGIRRRLSHRKLPHIVRIFLNQIREVRTRPRRRHFQRRPRIRRNIKVPIIRNSQRRRSRSRRLHRPSRNRRRHRPRPRHQQLSIHRQISAERSCRRRNSTAARIIQRRPVIRQCAVTAHRSSTCRIRRHLILARPRHRQRRPSLHSRSIRRQERIVRRSQPRRRPARPAHNHVVRRGHRIRKPSARSRSAIAPRSRKHSRRAHMQALRSTAGNACKGHTAVELHRDLKLLQSRRQPFSPTHAIAHVSDVIGNRRRRSKTQLRQAGILRSLIHPDIHIVRVRGRSVVRICNRLCRIRVVKCDDVCAAHCIQRSHRKIQPSLQSS